MAMMQGSNKPKKEGKPMGGPPVEMMTPEVLAPPTGMEGVRCIRINAGSG